MNQRQHGIEIPRKGQFSEFMERKRLTSEGQ